jgi:hypothetical protein
MVKYVAREDEFYLIDHAMRGALCDPRRLRRKMAAREKAGSPF